MHPTAPDFSGRHEALILPLRDEHIDATGFDPRSHYAETFWLPILGPSTLWLLRSIATRFDVEPDGFTMHLEEQSASLGIRSNGGRNNAFQRSLHRLVGFNMGRSTNGRSRSDGSCRHCTPDRSGGCRPASNDCITTQWNAATPTGEKMPIAPARSPSRSSSSATVPTWSSSSSSAGASTPAPPTAR